MPVSPLSTQASFCTTEACTLRHLLACHQLGVRRTSATQALWHQGAQSIYLPSSKLMWKPIGRPVYRIVVLQRVPLHFLVRLEECRSWRCLDASVPLTRRRSPACTLSPRSDRGLVGELTVYRADIRGLVFRYGIPKEMDPLLHGL